MQAFATRAIDVQRTDASMQLPCGHLVRMDLMLEQGMAESARAPPFLFRSSSMVRSLRSGFGSAPIVSSRDARQMAQDKSDLLPCHLRG